jgi:hypothetical protein
MLLDRFSHPDIVKTIWVSGDGTTEAFLQAKQEAGEGTQNRDMNISLACHYNCLPIICKQCLDVQFLTYSQLKD